MRQIFSVILAAALVFGGTLLFARYFEGIEVRDEGPPKLASGHPGDSNTGRSLWYCPEVERILIGPLPEIFEVQPEELAKFNETFRWVGVYLDDLIEKTNSSAKGSAVSCVYQQAGSPWGRAKLNLASSLQAEIKHDSRVEGGWRGLPGIDCGGYGFSCISSSRECGFYVLQAELQPDPVETGEEGACSLPVDEPAGPSGRSD